MSNKEPNPQYSIRPFHKDEDIPLLVQLIIEAEDRQPDEAQAIQSEIENSLTWEGHDPSQDRFVVVLSDSLSQIIAHASLFLQLSERVIASIGVHPKWRRQGIGSSLLECVRYRAKEYNATHIAIGTRSNDHVGQAFLETNNFQIAGHIRFFVAPADVPMPESNLPDDFTVRQFKDVKSLALLAEVQNRCYHDMWGHTENTEGVVTEEVLAEYMPKHPEFFNEAGIHILFAPDAEAIGVCYGRAGDEIGGNRQKIIDSPGIAPEYRHLDLQRPLTLIVMQWLRQTYGEGPIELHTYGDFERAVEIYEDLGFQLEPQKHIIDYRWDLPKT